LFHVTFIFNLTHMKERRMYFSSAYSHDAIQKKWFDWASQEVLDVDDILYLHTNRSTSKSNVLVMSFLVMSFLGDLVGIVKGGTKSQTQEHYYKLNVR
jgi:hypothetical protein